ncbi:hypothetical protein [Acetomicrobium sp.]|jgi:hypothetical protein|uniref:hypothetical protein n=1 Tax=Acetomicrobium sp. TaxID=1872099 RepID=UPI0028710E41|nr:hypothetical protein [Acetomicrobium sp.]MDR9769171.1 hypothetical protein [Acetomicrobium sp.]
MKSLIVKLMILAVIVFSLTCPSYAFFLTRLPGGNSVTIGNEEIWIDEKGNPIGVLRNISVGMFLPNILFDSTTPYGEQGVLIYSYGLYDYADAIIYTDLHKSWWAFWLTRDELNQLVPMLQKANDLSEKLHKTNVSLPEKGKNIGKVNGKWNYITVDLENTGVGIATFITFQNKETGEKATIVDYPQKLINIPQIISSVEEALPSIMTLLDERKSLMNELETE